MKAKGGKATGAIGAPMNTFRVPAKPLTPNQKARRAAAKAAAPKSCPECGGVLTRERVPPDIQWYLACSKDCGYRVKTTAP